MRIIHYIGMDVHTTNYTLCDLSRRINPISGDVEDRMGCPITIAPDYKLVVKFVDKLRSMNPADDVSFICGYEAGCLGYSLYHQLTDCGIECVILAPSTMAVSRDSNVKKNDKRDAAVIAKCLAFSTFKSVFIPSEQDDQVKEYIRMRDDHKQQLKENKQQIMAFCHRHGMTCEHANWSQKHLKWLKEYSLSPIYRETLDEYLRTYAYLTDKIESLDQRIKEFAQTPEYKSRVDKLVCLVGVQEHTALATIVETGDFSRFPTANHYAAYLGLIPAERSSGNKQGHYSITKAGNAHIRTLLTESANCFSRRKTGQKSASLKARQSRNSREVIAYADKANERLRRRFQHLVFSGKKHNVAKVAVARELACFIWGLMTDHIDLLGVG